MSAVNAAIHQLGLRSRGRRLRRRVLLFSFSCAVIAALLGGVVFYVTNVYIPGRTLEETNQKTFQRIHCAAQTCDVTEIANDFEFDGADYVLDKDTYFLLNFGSQTGDFSRFALHRSDPAFIGRFQTPASVLTPAGESWRLYSAVKELGSKRVAIMVGYAEQASWKMDLPFRSGRPIDAKLKEQLDRIRNSLRVDDGQVEVPGAARKIAVDGYEVVDLTNDEVLSGGYWLPVYLPRDKTLPHDGLSFYRDKYDLYLLRTDANERLLSVSNQSIGDLRTLVALFALLILVSGVAAYVSGTTFLRKYFVFSQSRPHTVGEALKLGEGPSVEFKRSVSFENPTSIEQILQTVTAFANSGDGTIFIGIEDDGKVKGIKLDSPKDKDNLSQRIFQAIRQRVKPSPSIQVDFVSLRGFEICTVFVPRGEDPLYFLDGVILVRYGSSDIKAQPEIVKRLLAAHAF
jgi:schlafen family protein